MKHVTLLFLLKPETQEICLAMKKRGFGEGKFNGVGGKIEEGETPMAATVREAKEEIGVIVDENDLIKVADLHFTSTKPDWDIRCQASVTSTWSGEPIESEEMKPYWFSVHSMPLEKMWVSDLAWLPKVLEGKTVTAHFKFNDDGSQILEREMTVGPKWKLE